MYVFDISKMLIVFESERKTCHSNFSFRSGLANVFYLFNYFLFIFDIIKVENN